MRFLYMTDLHGQKHRYSGALELAMQCEIPLIVNGGDMLPWGRDGNSATVQRTFVEQFLTEHFDACAQEGIRNLFIPGNDDLACVDCVFDALCQSNPMAVNLHGKACELDGWTFIGFNLVTDYPFRLKDRCRRDHDDFVLPLQNGTGLMSKPNGAFKELHDWPQRIAAMPSIKDELAKLPVPTNPARTVYVIHNPPGQLGLDACWRGATVGSRSVLEFLEVSGAPLALHGHIHESPQVTGVWNARAGETLCVQPGQRGSQDLVYVIVDTEKDPMVQTSMVKCWP